MSCILCGKFSIYIICKHCKDEYLKPVFDTRNLGGDFKVYSFFKLSDLKDLAHTKYCYIGHKIYNTISKIARESFIELMKLDSKIYLIPIDDTVKRGYSQNAIFAKNLKSKNLIPYYGVLRAKNDIVYAGKDLKYRESNKRDFQYSGKQNIDAIILDDIITTGTTMKEAKEVLNQYGVNVLFGLTLFDAKDEDDNFID